MLKLKRCLVILIGPIASRLLRNVTGRVVLLAFGTRGRLLSSVDRSLLARFSVLIRPTNR
jgi:hypothetical protein